MEQHINTVSTDMDLCVILVDRMAAHGFKPTSIERLSKHAKYFTQAQGQDPLTQLMYLVLALNDILMSGPHRVPNHIRLALNYSKFPEQWIDDVQTNVLPFMKENEEQLFG